MACLKTWYSGFQMIRLKWVGCLVCNIMFVQLFNIPSDPFVWQAILISSHLKSFINIKKIVLNIIYLDTWFQVSLFNTNNFQDLYGFKYLFLFRNNNLFTHLRIAMNYRGITLTTIADKIYNALLRNRIQPKIEKILLAYGLPKETVAAIMMLY